MFVFPSGLDIVQLEPMEGAPGPASDSPAPGMVLLDLDGVPSAVLAVGVNCDPLLAGCIGITVGGALDSPFDSVFASPAKRFTIATTQGPVGNPQSEASRDFLICFTAALGLHSATVSDFRQMRTRCRTLFGPEAWP